MKVAAAALSLFLASSAVAFAQGKPLTDQDIAQAAKACVSGQGERYGHPSNGCWVAHDAALKRRDFDLALSYVRAGCEKYNRGDFCLLMSQVQQPQIVTVGTAAASSRAGEALHRAAGLVTARDIEDGEWGVVLRERMRTAR